MDKNVISHMKLEGNDRNVDKAIFDISGYSDFMKIINYHVKCY